LSQFSIGCDYTTYTLLDELDPYFCSSFSSSPYPKTYWYTKIDSPKFEGPKQLQLYSMLVSSNEESLLEDFNEVSFPFAPLVEQLRF
jgi:hypothetical protein